MEYISKPSILRIARLAGIKSLSENSYPVIEKLIKKYTEEIIKNTLILTSQNNSKTIMVEDVYNSIHLLGYNIAESKDLSNDTLFN